MVGGLSLLAIIPVALAQTETNSQSRASEAADQQDKIALRLRYAGLPSTWPVAKRHPSAKFEEFGPLPRPAEPADNKATPERIALGELLFNSPALSASGQIACNSCHNRELGWGDGLKTSFGHNRQRGTRNAPSLFTVAWQENLFWDGRSPSLEHQAMMPVLNPIEMAGTKRRIEARLNRDQGLRRAFLSAYGVRRIKLENTAQALGTFQRSIRPRNSKWDRVVKNEGGSVLNDEELLGLDLFRTKAGCASCHNGPLLSDQRVHNLGLTFFGRSLEDRGRFLVTGDPADVGRFKTPSLRSVRHTAPYMHNGVLPNLEGVVNFYNGAGGQPRRVGEGRDSALFPITSPMLQPLGLTPAEKAALIAYLETL